MSYWSITNRRPPTVFAAIEQADLAAKKLALKHGDPRHYITARDRIWLCEVMRLLVSAVRDAEITVEQAQAANQAVITLWDYAAAGVGFVVMAIGRVRANPNLNWLPKPRMRLLLGLVATLVLTGCAMTPLEMDESCIVVTETRSLLGIVRPGMIALGPAYDRVILTSTECETRTIIEGSSIEVEQRHEDDG